MVDSFPHSRSAAGRDRLLIGARRRPHHIRNHREGCPAGKFCPAVTCFGLGHFAGGSTSPCAGDIWAVCEVYRWRRAAEPGYGTSSRSKALCRNELQK